MNWCKCRRCGKEYDYDAPESAVGSIDELCSQCLQDTDRWLQEAHKEEDRSWTQICMGTKPKRMTEL